MGWRPVQGAVQYSTPRVFAVCSYLIPCEATVPGTSSTDFTPPWRLTSRPPNILGTWTVEGGNVVTMWQDVNQDGKWQYSLFCWLLLKWEASHLGTEPSLLVSRRQSLRLFPFRVSTLPWRNRTCIVHVTTKSPKAILYAHIFAIWSCKLLFQ